MTLTPARQRVTSEMLDTLTKMRAKGVHFGIVSGSDLVKVREQMTQEVADGADWCFAENGLDAYKLGVEVEKQSINKHLGEDKLKRLINFILHYIADLDIPIKRGTFIEFRNGMLNVSPIGRNCSKQERDEFEQFDKTAGVRSAFVEVLTREFADLNLRFSIGGQISFDVFPLGWDKSFCLKFIEQHYDEIHFWGDKTAQVSYSPFTIVAVTLFEFDREGTTTRFLLTRAQSATPWRTLTRQSRRSKRSSVSSEAGTCPLVAKLPRNELS